VPTDTVDELDEIVILSISTTEEVVERLLDVVLWLWTGVV